MDLREFVKSALVQIAEGVRDAQAVVGDTGARINPVPIIYPKAVGEGMLVDREAQLPFRDIEFDIAVTASEGSGSSAKINVVAAFLGGGVEGRSDKQSERVSRVKFSVPIVFPKLPDGATSGTSIPTI